MPAPWGPVGEGAGEGPGKAAGSQLPVCLVEGGDGRVRGDRQEMPAGNPACGAEGLAGRSEAKTHSLGLMFPGVGSAPAAPPHASGNHTPTLSVTTKTVSQHCQVSPGGKISPEASGGIVD